jgi:1-acyl-sn-glycerol-3-phosphate acyltransferase
MLGSDSNKDLVGRDEGHQLSFPPKERLALLNPIERTGFRLAYLMNSPSWKPFWTFLQRHIGSLWIRICTYNLMKVFGLENVKNSDESRPLLLVANHRSFFDMYTVSSVIFRQTTLKMRLFFPVRGKFFYTNPLGWVVNLVMGWWAMYPPFFRESKEASKRDFDKFSMASLVEICAKGSGTVVGFHPEGKRNLSPDPYNLLPAQPGVGAVVIKAKPQVIPVFIAGLGNNLLTQVLGNWFGGPKVRIWFGEPVDLSEFYLKDDRLRTHKEISDHLMGKVGELAELDREWMATRN